MRDQPHRLTRANSPRRHGDNRMRARFAIGSSFSNARWNRRCQTKPEKKEKKGKKEEEVSRSAGSSRTIKIR